MKKIKYLLALIVVITLISTVALAADYSVIKGAVDNKITYESGDLTISVVSTGAYGAFGPQASIGFDTEKWTVSDVSTEVTGGTAVVNTNTKCPTMSCMDSATLADGTVLISAKFTPIDGQDVIGSKFTVYSYWLDDVSYAEMSVDNVEYTVVAASVEPTKYDVTYNTDGASSATPTQDAVEAGTKITLAAAPTKAGYTFKGWKDGTSTYAAGAEYEVNAAVTFTAQWEKDAPTPVVPTGSGSVGDVKVGDTTYTNVYTGEFSATPAEGTKFTKIGAIFYPSDWESKDDSYKTEHPKMDLSKDVNFEGTGVLTFKAAIVGVPDGVTIVSEPYTVSVNK